MSPTATVRVMSAEEIASRGGGSPPAFRWPERTTFFAERAMRLRQLAAGHAMGEYLRFVGRIALAQQAALTRLGREGGVPVPDAAAIDRASLAGRPPLDIGDSAARDPAWRGILREIVRALRAETPAGPAAEALARLEAADEVFLERQADALLTGVMAGLDLATAPLVAAALQVQWTHQAIEIAAAQAARASAKTQAAQATLPIGRLDEAGICPCCGSRPLTSVTRSTGESSGQRYLHCSLCGTEWHLPRGRCTHCGEAGAEKVAYQSLDRRDEGAAAGAEADDERGAHAETDGERSARAETDDERSARAARAPIQAETCEACGHYLKIVHGDRDPFAEPAADDLASITLDLLVAESGKQRHGVNLMLLFGDPGEGDRPPACASGGP